MFRFKKKEKIEIPLEVPKHIGSLWMAMVAGRKSGCNRASSVIKAGMEALQEVTIAAKNMGVQVLTVYAFSNGKLDTP